MKSLQRLANNKVISIKFLINVLFIVVILDTFGPLAVLLLNRIEKLSKDDKEMRDLSMTTV